MAYRFSFRPKRLKILRYILHPIFVRYYFRVSERSAPTPTILRHTGATRIKSKPSRRLPSLVGSECKPREYRPSTFSVCRLTPYTYNQGIPRRTSFSTRDPWGHRNTNNVPTESRGSRNSSTLVFSSGIKLMNLLWGPKVLLLVFLWRQANRK